MTTTTDSNQNLPDFPDHAFDDFKGAIYYLPDENYETLSDSLSQLSQQISFNTAKAKTLRNLQALLDGLHALCSTHAYHLTDLVSLQDKMGIKRTGVLRRLENMEKFAIDVIKIYRGINGANRSVAQFDLNEINLNKLLVNETESLFELQPPSELTTVNSIKKNITEALNLEAQTLNTKIFPKGERFSTFYLLSALPSGTKGKIVTQSYSTKIKVANDSIDIRVSPTVGYRIANIRDFQIFNAVISILHRRCTMYGRLDIEQFFSLDEICDELGLEPQTNNKLRTIEALRRIRHTNFYIEHVTSGISRELRNIYRDLVDFSLISDIAERHVYDGDSHQEINNMIRITFNSDLVRRIMEDGGSLLSALHRQSYSERNPFDYRLYLWLRRAYHKYRSYEHAFEHARTLHSIHVEVEPMREFRKFKHDFKSFLQRKHKAFEGGYAYAHMYGYNVLVLNDDFEQIVIWTDERDEIVGRNTYRSYMKAKKAKQLAGE